MMCFPNIFKLHFVLTNISSKKKKKVRFHSSHFVPFGVMDSPPSSIRSASPVRLVQAVPWKPAAVKQPFQSLHKIFSLTKQGLGHDLYWFLFCFSSLFVFLSICYVFRVADASSLIGSKNAQGTKRRKVREGEKTR